MDSLEYITKTLLENAPEAVKAEIAAKIADEVVRGLGARRGQRWLKDGADAFVKIFIAGILPSTLVVVLLVKPSLYWQVLGFILPVVIVVAALGVGNWRLDGFSSILSWFWGRKQSSSTVPGDNSELRGYLPDAVTRSSREN